MKITEYPVITEVSNDNVFIVDGNNGTKQILATDAVLSALSVMSSNNRRNIFRGKNLGSSLTSAQKSAIQNGSFDDLWLGDYWVINGVNWRIVDFNYWYNCGDTEFVKNHVVVMPDTNIHTGKMNSTQTTAGGYVGSSMYTSIMPTVKNIVTNAFGSAVLSHREFLTTAVTGDYPSAGSWYDSTVELPNEIMIYGSHIAIAAGGAVKSHTVSKTQLALFANCPQFINNRQNYWLRDVASSMNFALVSYTGAAHHASASADNYGIRPVFAIG